MDRELSCLRKCYCIAGWIIAVAFGSVPTQSQIQRDTPFRRHDEKVLVFNELDYVEGQKTNGPNSCIWPLILNADGLAKKPDAESRCPFRGDNRELFLTHGKRSELRVFNRKFFTGYSITIAAVTSIQSSLNIRNLSEAANLSLGAISLAGAPPSKGGTEGITPRSSEQILYQLLNEGTSTKPKIDLDADQAVIEREQERIDIEFEAFKEAYESLVGQPRTDSVNLLKCQQVNGTLLASVIKDCFESEIKTDSEGPDWGQAPYSNEQAFRDLLDRVGRLMRAVKDFGVKLSAADVAARGQKLVIDVSQYENDALTLQSNVRASQAAATLALNLLQSPYRSALRREQLRNFLSQQLKNGQSGTQNPEDLADMNELLDDYKKASGASLRLLIGNSNELLCIAGGSTACVRDLPAVGKFRTELERVQKRIDVALPEAINDINRAQSVLLNRVNDIYDKSKIPEPLLVPILYNEPSGSALSSSVLTHNYIVYYTIRRIEYFKKLRVVPLASTNSESGSTSSNVVPPSNGTSAPQGGSATGSSGQGSAGNSTETSENPVQPQGIEVSSWSFEVHDFFHVNIAAGFAFSSLKDQSIAKQASPLNCNGTAKTPDSNCFIPVLNANNRQENIMIAFEYYLQAQDTFPRDKYSRSWLCGAHPWQCFGPMGGLSLTKANNYFLGAFFEPVIGIQVLGGANFGIETTLEKSFTFGMPADINGDFPTYQKRATGWFLSAGFDFGIFRKVFGKVTGIGTAKSAQGS